MHVLRQVLVFPLIALVRVYQWGLKPMLRGNACRFAPTCSEYMIQALKVHGPIRGLWLGIRRIGRCHPWGGHGWDPVPPPSRNP